MKRLLISGSIMFILGAASAVLAHHSAAGIDQTKTVTVEGVVKQFKWANPHSWLEMEVVNAKGVAEIWNFEMMPPTYLIRGGWKSNSVKPGDKVKVTARPFKNGDPGGLFQSATLPSGQVLTSGTGGGARGGAPGGAPAQPPAPR